MARRTKKQRRQWLWIYITKWVCKGNRAILQRVHNFYHDELSHTTRQKLAKITKALEDLSELVDANYKAGREKL